ncbi:protein FAM236D isoform X2 [Fukomys damarensis]|uniref:protein FAM236D isoform X2 n=1 Tax=Fukomys damarensis TaxID=885580 RepID=UPI00053FB813|nr:protein FAM236D isoform X2 [Fukomys damarensis]
MIFTPSLPPADWKVEDRGKGGQERVSSDTMGTMENTPRGPGWPRELAGLQRSRRSRIQRVLACVTKFFRGYRAL